MELIVEAMDRTESCDAPDARLSNMWNRLACQVIFFIIRQTASFPHMVLALHEKVRTGVHRVGNTLNAILEDGQRMIISFFVR